MVSSLEIKTWLIGRAFTLRYAQKTTVKLMLNGYFLRSINTRWAIMNRDMAMRQSLRRKSPLYLNAHLIYRIASTTVLLRLFKNCDTSDTDCDFSKLITKATFLRLTA